MPKTKEDIKADLKGILGSVAATLVVSKEDVLKEFSDRVHTAILDYANKLVGDLPDSDEIKKRKAADLVAACSNYSRGLLSLELLAEEITRILLYYYK